MPDRRGRCTAFEWIRELSREILAWPIRCDGANPRVDQDGRALEMSKTQDDACEAMKRLVREAPVLRFYDPDKELSIQCDASQTGLGVALLQDGQPLAFVSRALTDTETRYAQLEKEMLAVVWSI